MAELHFSLPQRFRLDLNVTSLANVVVIIQGQVGAHSLPQSWVHLAMSKTFLVGTLGFREVLLALMGRSQGYC